jgi:hypothetical protein
MQAQLAADLSVYVPALLATVFRGEALTALTIHVPRINDELADFYHVAWIWGKVMEAGDGTEVTFDFSRCDFLRPNAVVFLGGLRRMIGYRGGTARFKMGTMHNQVRANLEQNGFAYAMGADVLPWQGNSIPYREYVEQDQDSIVQYLKNDWLGRQWVNLSDALASAIAGQMWEIFANAFEHADSRVGIYCCGQHLPRLGELLLAVADFGVGIPFNARIYRREAGLTAEQAMRWAFERGTSTSRRTSGPRGVGPGLA